MGEMWRYSVIIGIGGVFLGCCLNAVFLEYLVKADPGSGTLTTFSQYVFIAIEGYINTMKLGTRKRQIPLISYCSVVSMFLIANVANNYAFNFNISMPLHMIFRSGSLITNMFMGMILLNKKYDVIKFLSVSFITLGVIICTLVTGSEMKKDTTPLTGVNNDFFWWLFGICILILALFVSSLLGIYQEELYAKYGKHPNEALFFSHLLPLPMFFIFRDNIIEHFKLALSSSPLKIPVLNFYIPSTIIFLIGNVLTQYICIKSVYFLSAEASSLSVTLVLTLRKFLSLFFSIWYFNNTFTVFHWFGTFCVFIGTLLFTEILSKMFVRNKIKDKNT